MVRLFLIRLCTAILRVALQYITHTLPDISHVVQQIYFHMHDPRDTHLILVKYVLRYLKCTTTVYNSPGPLLLYLLITRMRIGLAAPTHDIPPLISAYLLVIIWCLGCLNNKNAISRPSVEAEYRVVANVISEATWLQQLL